MRFVSMPYLRKIREKYKKRFLLFLFYLLAITTVPLCAHRYGVTFHRHLFEGHDGPVAWGNTTEKQIADSLRSVRGVTSVYHTGDRTRMPVPVIYKKSLQAVMRTDLSMKRWIPTKKRTRRSLRVLELPLLC